MLKRVTTYLLAMNIASLCSLGLFAQKNIEKEQELNPVTITGTKKILFDPALRPRLEIQGGNTSLGQGIQAQNILFLRSYGPGLLSSMSSRGTDPTHTPILWNGFSLQNAVNANPDPAIENIPPSYQAAYYPGGQSGLFGSGAIGGTVHVSPAFSAPMGIHAKAGIEIGSFGRHSETISLGYKTNRSTISAGLRLFKSLNNFQFVNRTLFSKPTQRLPHAEANGSSLNAEWKHELKKGGIVEAALWYQHTVRQIPPTMLSSLSNAEQTDENVRSVLGWKKSIKGKHNLALKTAFLYDYLFYNSQSLTIPSLMVQYASLSRAEYDYRFLPKHAIFIGLNHSYYKVFMEEYKGVAPQRNQSDLFIGYKYELPKKLGEVAVQAVEEFTDGKFAPFCPALSALIKPKIYLPIRIRINRNYRQATFNDLYWTPGGNPNLVPETGFSQEVGFGFDRLYTRSPKGHPEKTHHIGISVFATGFHNVIQNRITWIPGSVYWSPVNIDRTRAYGAEIDVKCTWEYKKWLIKFSANYSYTKSVRDKERFDGDPTYKKQIIYIPQHLAGGSISIAYNTTSIFFQQRYTGKRYTLADNSTFLTGFQTASVGISQDVNVLGIQANLWFICDNVGNVSYEVLEYRPMPGRNYRVGLTIGFNKKINK